MSIEKLKQMGTLDEKSTYTTSLGFVRAINNNADELGTTKKLDLRTKNTPKHIAQALKEQAKNKISYKTMGGPDDLPDYEQGPTNSPSSLKDGLAQIYNKELATQPDPDPLTNIDFDIVSGLQEGESNTAPGSLIATLSAVGGKAPFVYSFNNDAEAGKDNNRFTIEGDKIKLGEDTIAAGNYKISVKVEDANNSSIINSTVITILPAKPEITNLNINIVDGLQEGNENVAANAVIGTLSATGGTSPYTYTLGSNITGKNNSSFVVEEDKVKVGTTALTAGNYIISIIATDKNKKTLEKVTNFTVDAASTSA